MFEQFYAKLMLIPYEYKTEPHFYIKTQTSNSRPMQRHNGSRTSKSMEKEQAYKSTPTRWSEW